MGTRYIQAAVSDEDHAKFVRFAAMHFPPLTMSDLIEAAVVEYIEKYTIKRKEEANASEVEAGENP